METEGALADRAIPGARWLPKASRPVGVCRYAEKDQELGDFFEAIGTFFTRVR